MIKAEWGIALAQDRRVSLLFVVLVIWLWKLFGSRTYKATLPLSYRIQIICLSLILVGSTTMGVFGFWWRVFHPSFLGAYFWPATAPLGPELTVTLRTLSVVAAHMELIIGWRMIQQKRKLRRFALRAVPFLLVIHILDLVEMAAMRRHESIVVFIASALVVGPDCWLYGFCRSNRTEELMKG
jgi:hypothetical protein